MKKYDVVIVNYNGEKILKECLNSVYASSVPPKRVIIYDNASRDLSVDLIKKDYPKAFLIEGKTNIGFGPGNNEAMKRVESDFVLFLNNDITLDKKCAEKLIQGFVSPEVAVLNPLIYKGWDKVNNQEIYSFGAEMNKSGFGYSLYDIAEDRDDLSCFSGACFMARTSLIKKLKFEKSFFLYYEEPDLSAKLLISGYTIGRRKESVCYHLENYSSPQNRSAGICFRQFFAIQNRWFMLGKFWPAGMLWSAMPLNILHLLYNAIFFLRHKKYKQLSILSLAFQNLSRGRREYIEDQKHCLAKHLAKNDFKKAFGLSKKVYK